MDSLVQTIDLSGWFTGDAESRRAVVEAIDCECRRVGFLRVVWTAYFVACQALASELTRMFAVALGMPADFIFDKIHRAACVMRANNYERRSHHADPDPGQVRMGAHTDYGVCTILLADPVAGLQIVGPDGAWRDVLPEPGTFLVNLGDLLAEWTNDRWRSTLHRVVPPTIAGPARRRSVAFFQEANYDALVEVMPTCVGDDNPARYTPVIAGEHLMNKLIGPRTLQRSTAAQTTAASNVAGERLTKKRLRELITEGQASGPGQRATPELFAEIRDRAMALPL